MKYPRLYIAANCLHIQLSQSNQDILTINKDGKLSLVYELDVDLFKHEQVTRKVAIQTFGKQLKALRLLPLVEQEPSFDFPIYSYLDGKYFIQISDTRSISISLETDLCDFVSNAGFKIFHAEKIITREEFFAACGEYIEKENLKEIFTVLND